MKRIFIHILVFLMTLLIGTLVGQTYFQHPVVESSRFTKTPFTKIEPEIHLEVIEVRDSDTSRWNLNSGYLTMYDAVFLDDQNILALFLQDGMRISHDGGKSWQSLFSESYGLPRATGGFTVNGLDFLDSKTGWAFGTRLIKTVDGGQTWTNIKLPEWIDNQRVKFLNEDVGLIAGRGGYCESYSGRCNTWLSVYKTVNGGKTWRKSFKTKNFDTPWDIVYVDEKIAMITGGGSWLYRTADGGKSWKAVLKKDFGRVMSISRSPDGRFWLFGKNSIRFSDDLGSTWNRAENVSEDIVNKEWWSVDFTKDGLGVAVSEESAIAVSRDGGQSWKLMTSNLHTNDKLPVRDNPFMESLRGVRLQGTKGIITGSQRNYLISFPN